MTKKKKNEDFEILRVAAIVLFIAMVITGIYEMFTDNFFEGFVLAGISLILIKLEMIFDEVKQK